MKFRFIIFEDIEKREDWICKVLMKFLFCFIEILLNVMDEGSDFGCFIFILE